LAAFSRAASAAARSMGVRCFRMPEGEPVGMKVIVGGMAAV
jgi:hypothetical protein